MRAVRRLVDYCEPLVDVQYILVRVVVLDGRHRVHWHQDRVEALASSTWPPHDEPTFTLDVSMWATLAGTQCNLADVNYIARFSQINVVQDHDMWLRVLLPRQGDQQQQGFAYQTGRTRPTLSAEHCLFIPRCWQQLC